MTEAVGYQLIRDADGVVVAQWGGTRGQDVTVPPVLLIPEEGGTFLHVHAPELGGTYAGHTLVRWEMEEPDPTSDDVSRERDRRIAAGVTVALSDGRSFRVQTRDERDFRNIQGVSSVGMARLASGDTTTTVTFRDLDNADQVLSPAQCVELGLLVAAEVDRIYKRSWAIKAEDPLPGDYRDDWRWS